MVGPFLREATILIVFCHIFVSAEDLLEIFRPDPSLPEELNDWLSRVQQHKDDFSFIRESVGEEPKKLFHFNEDYGDAEEANREDLDSVINEYHNNKKSEDTDDRPRNDIYPNMFQNLNDDFPLVDKNLLSKRKANSRNIRNPARHRRSSNEIPFFEHRDSVNVKSLGKIGELKRSDDKYPEGYHRNENKNIEDSNIAGRSNVNVEKDNSKLNDVEKREIEIDIKNDGKLVKQIHEETNGPRSIVLNIQSPEAPSDELTNSKIVNPSLNKLDSYKGSRLNTDKLADKANTKLELNTRSESNELKSKELQNNYNNLLTANERLVTDNNLARESSTTGHLIALPEFNLFRDLPYSNVQQPQNHETGNLNKNNSKNKQSPRQYNFIDNNMRDMSNYWTNLEKNQMQKGLERARVSKNFAAQPVQLLPKNKEDSKTDDTKNGFEIAQPIVLDSKAGTNSDTRDVSDTDKKGMSNFKSGVDNMNMNSNGMSLRDMNMNSNGMNLRDMNMNSNGLNLKDMNINDLNSMTSLNTMKMVSGSNGTVPLLGTIGLNAVGINPMSSLNSGNYVLGLNQPAVEGNPNASQDISKLQNKRQLLDGTLQLNNDNFGGSALALENFSDDGDLVSFSNQYVTEAKRNDDTCSDKPFEKMYPLEPDKGSIDLVQNPPDNPQNIESVNLDEPPSMPDKIDVQSGAETLLTDKKQEPQNTGYNNPEPMEPNYNQLPPAPEKACEEIPTPQEHIQPIEEHHPSKHIKGFIRKLNKNYRNDNRVSEVETVTEIDYPDASEINIGEGNGKEIRIQKYNANEESDEENGMRQNERIRHDDVNCCDEPKSNNRGKEFQRVDNDPKVDTEPQRKDLFNREPQQNNRKAFSLEDNTHHQNARPFHRGKHISDKSFNNQHMRQNRKKIHPHNKPFGINKIKYFNSKEPRIAYDYIKDSPRPLELLVKKRDSGNNNHRRRRHRKNPGRDRTRAFIKDSQEYIEDLNDRDASVVTLSNLNVLIPSFIKRQLKTLDYEYDAYLHRPGENFEEEISTEQEAATKINHHAHQISTTRQNIHARNKYHSDTLHKNSVEGDYGEEEDSVTEARKKKGNIMIKKTKNEFANPRTTTESEDYKDYDNYDGVSVIEKEEPKMESHKQKKGSMKKITHRQVRKGPVEASKGHDVKSFAHHRHKYKPRPKHKQGTPLKKIDTNSFGDSIPRSELQSEREQSDGDIFPRQNILDSKSEFQHWPGFVIDDRQNEENLRKRSLVMKNKYPRAFEFPLASKDFFVKQQKRDRPAAVKREKPDLLLDQGNLLQESKKLVSDNDNKVTVAEEKSTNATQTTEDYDIDTCASEVETALTNICEEKANFNKTTVQVTTILAIAAENDTQECDNSKLDVKSNITTQEKLDDILSGKLPFQLVNDIRERVSANVKLKKTFNKGLKPLKHDTSFLNSLNDSNRETQKLVDSMTNIMNKLQYTATCQGLPRKLRHYLRAITKANKVDPLAKTREMEEIEFDEGQNQDNFVFESSPQGDNFQGKVKVLQDLLNRFNKLPERCKTRAMPVKEYIENHLGMLNNMLNSIGSAGAQKKLKPKKSIETVTSDSFKNQDELIQEQLDSLGLGKKHNFKPRFDLDQMVENKKQGKTSTANQKPTERSTNKNVIKRGLHTVSRSIKYDKLVDAVRRLRLRRENQKRIADLYGRSSRDSGDYDDFQDDVKNSEGGDLSQANFESPLVYSF